MNRIHPGGVRGVGLGQPLAAGEPVPPTRLDQSVWFLVTVNAIALGVALWQDWSVIALMAVYWLQSVVIGGFNVARIWSLRQFSVEGLKINGRPAVESDATRRSTAIFFAVHYGIFHAVYIGFLAGSSRGAPIFDHWFVLCAIGFVANHFFSYRYNREQDLRGRPNIGTLMFTPYVRIVPMHLTIIFGGLLAPGAFGLIFFGILKTVADVVMHRIEHALWRKGETTLAT